MDFKILYLEDEDMIREVITEYMNIAGYKVTTCVDGEEAITLLNSNVFDLAILDINVPKKSGLDVLTYIEEKGFNIATIMLTAYGDEKTQVDAFNRKADDFIIKPVAPIILLKRIESILRRTEYLRKIKEENKEPSLVNIESNSEKKLTINKESYRAYYDGVALNLTLSELLLLETLMDKPNMVFTREQLINIIFNESYIASDRIIDTHVKNLRKKLPKNYIKTVIGIGYKFSDEEI